MSGGEAEEIPTEEERKKLMADYIAVEAELCNTCMEVHPVGACRQMSFDFGGPLDAGTSCGDWTVQDEIRMREGEKVRRFTSGATRDTDEGKHDIEAFLNPQVMQVFFEYMHTNRFQKDGTVRAGDNWQKGMDRSVYIKSGIRHVHDWHLLHRGYPAREDLKQALCGVMFNVMGYLHEVLREEQGEK